MFIWFIITWISLLQYSGVIAEPENYLGCYKDDGGFDNRLMTGHRSELFGLNSPKVCIELCQSKGFAHAGLQYEYECFCDNAIPSYRLRALESECSHKCSGDETQICGGDWRLSVYKTGVSEATRKEKLEYIGCVTDDDPNNRFLNGYHEDVHHSLTPHYCIGLCYSLGYLYAGMQYSLQCFCGDRHPNSDARVFDPECSKPCTGDKNEKCGGDWRLSVYSTSITDLPIDGKYLGCYIDNSSKRSLTGVRFNLMKTNTPRRCMNLCRANKYRYSGVQYKNECFCGDDTRNVPRNAVSDKDCELPCTGDFTNTCGGNWRIGLYRTGYSPNSEESTDFGPAQYDGCYEDKFQSFANRVVKGYKQELYGTLTPELCIDICRNKGFHFSATQYMYECFCDDRRPQGKLRVKDEECDSLCQGDQSKKCGGGWRYSVFNTGLKSPVGNHHFYIGCFKDDAVVMSGGSDKFTNEKYLKPDLCVSYCLGKGYTVAGLMKGVQCLCGNPVISIKNKLEDEECSITCPGDKRKKCGGDSKLSLYRTAVILKKDKDVAESYLGCFDTFNKPLNDYRVDLEQNSPRRCIGLCLALGFHYAGLEYGVQCFCGNVAPQRSLKVNENDCHVSCPNNEDKKCGGGNRQNVYTTGAGYVAPSSLQPHPVPDNSSEFEDKVKQSNTSGVVPTPNPCEPSITEVNGKSQCKNEVIFEEYFDNDLSRDKWSKTVQIRDYPSNFVIFTNNASNCFTRDGKLHIEPTLVPDEQVDGGSIDLPGCTGDPGTSECYRESVTFNILPPIFSAEISTVNSFYFQYGTIEVIAKLPVGDWLIPELWLEPKYKAYGAHLSSGRIRLVHSLGNGDLYSKDGEKISIGSQYVESSLLMSNGNYSKAKKFVKFNNDGWNQQFHNYTFVWGPDHVKFMIDSAVVEEYRLSHKKKLCSEIGFSSFCSKIWGGGSNFAPFDTEFFITLGLTAGGNDEFPDMIVSNGHEKPWRNFGTKALLNFWMNKTSWFPTWSDSSLQVDSIKVTAL